MLCTRWFLPLLVLPVPTAQPFFLLLFLTSLVLHAKPCFYCISLLTALFMSSCYWQPVPIDSPLSTPWSPNITTFSEALDAVLPNISISKPSLIRMADRCWVDWSFGGMFEPFNITEWELRSVLKLKAELEKEEKARLMGEDKSVGPDEEFVKVHVPGTERMDATGNASRHTQDASGVAFNHTLRPRHLTSIFHFLSDSSLWGRRSPSDSSSSADTASKVQCSSKPTCRSEAGDCCSSSTQSDATVTTSNHGLHWFRREYDLRPHGFDIIFDFGWSRWTATRRL